MTTRRDSSSDTRLTTLLRWRCVLGIHALSERHFFYVEGASKSNETRPCRARRISCESRCCCGPNRTAAVHEEGLLRRDIMRATSRFCRVSVTLGCFLLFFSCVPCCQLSIRRHQTLQGCVGGVYTLGYPGASLSLTIPG